MPESFPIAVMLDHWTGSLHSAVVFRLVLAFCDATVEPPIPSMALDPGHFHSGGASAPWMQPPIG